MAPRWKRRLTREVSYQSALGSLDPNQFLKLTTKKRVTSYNHDTGLAIDWPHYCAHATTACGGEKGYCYTFSGFQATDAHSRHVALVDFFARRYPVYFADKVALEVAQGVSEGRLAYKNLRYSGSGEISLSHLPALKLVLQHGIHLWGFTRDITIALELRNLGAATIFSCDATSAPNAVDTALRHKLPIAYVSSGVDDFPPFDAFVVFPVHRGGRVSEVVDHPSLCPKVLFDFFHDSRPLGSCQTSCLRCHLHGGDVSS